MKSKKPNKFFSYLRSLLKIGLIGFGGGNALIPIFNEEFKKNKYINEEDFHTNIIIANLTPGALPVEISAGIGLQLKGSFGMILSAIAISLPGVLFSIIFFIFSINSNEEITKEIIFCTIGIFAFISLLLINFIKENMFNLKLNNKFQFKNFLIICFVFLLICGKNINKIIGFDVVPYLSTIQIFWCFIFFIYFKNNTKILNTTSILISVAYIASSLICNYLSFQKISTFYFFNIIRNFILFIMIALLIAKIVIKLIKRKNNLFKIFNNNYLKIFKNVLIIIIPVIICFIPAVLISSQAFQLLINGFLSTILSFGGGDAYIPLVEGFFIENNIIDANIFYNNVIPIVNIFPGSILAKTLSCLGLIIGYQISNNYIIGLTYSLLGLSICITTSCLTFYIVKIIYNEFSNTNNLMLVKNNIKLIISAFLINIVFTFLVQLTNFNYLFASNVIPIILFVIILILLIFIKRLINNKLLLLVIISIASSLLLSNLIFVII